MTDYIIDTHIHTAEVSSCGRVHAEEVVELYKEKKYDALVITDHYFEAYFEKLGNRSWKEKIDSYLEGYRTARKKGKKSGLDVFLGIELRFNSHPNDFLVYGVDENFLYDFPELYRMTPKEFSELKKGKGIAFFQAHPFRKNMEVEKNKYIDGIEVINGNPRHDSGNMTAYNHALKNNLRMLSGSDFHQYQDLARGGVITERSIKSSGDFAQYLLNNESKKLIGESLLSV